MEAEWGVFMFFSDFKDARRSEGSSKKTEKLMIFGPERNRKGAELKVLSSVETKNPGYITRDMKEGTTDDDGFGMDIFCLKDEDVSFALGKQGSTRMKLETASGCITQFVGNWAHFAGTAEERQRIKEYLLWLLQQRRGEVTVGDCSKRNDVTEMTIPRDAIGYVTGNRGQELRNVENETGTYCFMALDPDGGERLCIFGHIEGTRHEMKGRMLAER